jgi:hypothetical protein
MSWHLENTGTRQDVEAAIDEAVSAQSGMPASVGAYLKDAIAACAPPTSGYLISVRSTGHRPITGWSAAESCEVKLLQRGPHKQQFQPAPMPMPK